MADPRDSAARLDQLLDQVEILSPHQYRLGATLFRVPDFSPLPFGGQFTPFATGTPALVGDLQQKLYEQAYVRPFREDGGGAEAMPEAGASLLPELAAANATRERWEAGWQVTQTLPDGSIWARREGISQSFAAGLYRPSPAYAGAAVEVFLAKGSAEIQPGFYHVFGETPLDEGAAGRLTRLYFHLADPGAPLVVNAVSTLLNRFQLPFRMKALAFRGAYTRADSAVLFFAKRHFSLFARLLPRWLAAAAGHLRPAAPLFTKPLRPGVALAEDPADGESFGTSRCRLLAQALWEAFGHGRQGAAARRAELAALYARQGLDLERPYLRAGSADVYQLPAAAREAA